MPVVDIRILGLNFEIQCQKNEIEKLKKLEKILVKKVSKYEHLTKTNSEINILLLSLLMSENEILELRKKLENNKIDISNLNQINIIENKKNQEIILLKDEITKYKKEYEEIKKENLDKDEMIKEVNLKILKLMKKITDNYE